MHSRNKSYAGPGASYPRSSSPDIIDSDSTGNHSNNNCNNNLNISISININNTSNQVTAVGAGLDVTSPVKIPGSSRASIYDNNGHNNLKNSNFSQLRRQWESSSAGETGSPPVGSPQQAPSSPRMAHGSPHSPSPVKVNVTASPNPKTPGGKEIRMVKSAGAVGSVVQGGGKRFNSSYNSLSLSLSLSLRSFFLFLSYISYSKSSREKKTKKMSNSSDAITTVGICLFIYFLISLSIF